MRKALFLDPMGGLMNKLKFSSVEKRQRKGGLRAKDPEAEIAAWVAQQHMQKIQGKDTTVLSSLRQSMLTPA